MPSRPHWISFACYLIFFCSTALAQQLEPQNKQLINQLSSHSTWKALLHYRPHGLIGNVKSEADDDSFFLAENGASNAQSELNASLLAFAQTVTPNQVHAICRYPARFHWLKEKLGESLRNPTVQCDDLNKWLAAFNAQSLTLIYPAAYLNSPSSMYGHTLIRVDPHGNQKRSALLAQSINFAAEADPTDSEIVFSWKGITGGYPGQLSVQKYYTKVNDYSSIENRDIWEYKLKLSQEEVDQFLRHIWELRNVRFDYYFADENCAYRILAIIDAAVENIDAYGDFRFYATPVDTIRILVNAGLIKQATYRPSMATTLRHQISETPEVLQKLAVTSVSDPTILQSTNFLEHSVDERAQVLDLAYGYLRYTGKKNSIDSKTLSRQSLALLSTRAKLGVPSSYPPVKTPTTRDEMGHESARVMATIGSRDGAEFTDIGLRLTYHDLLDPSPGYLPGSAIAMGDLKIRIDDTGTIKLQHLGLVDITSYSPRDDFFSPISWRVATGIKRYENEQLSKPLAYIEGGSGLAYSSTGGLLFGLLEAELNTNNDLDKGFALGAGLQLGYLIQKPSWQGLLSARYLEFFEGANYRLESIKGGLSYNITTNSQIRFSLSEDRINHQGDLTTQLGYHYYF